MKDKVLITTVPFGEHERTALNLLECNNIPYVLNPFGRKLTEDDLINLIPEFEIIIAGTEPITARVLKEAKKLKLISRVGVGLDSVDLNECLKKNIQVSYTPDAPVKAVSELTVGLMLSLLRSIHLSNLGMHRGNWNRYFGRRISQCSVGVIGNGRIGSSLVKQLLPFNPQNILVHDIRKIFHESKEPNLSYNVGFSKLLELSDIISIHVPLTDATRNMISEKELKLMKNDALLINTARGGIVNESDLFTALSDNSIGGAAIDVFETEPYNGPLIKLDNCLLTSHMGSMSMDCRAEMETRATQNVVSFLLDNYLPDAVPVDEYEVQMAQSWGL